MRKNVFKILLFVLLLAGTNGMYATTYVGLGSVSVSTFDFSHGDMNVSNSRVEQFKVNRWFDINLNVPNAGDYAVDFKSAKDKGDGRASAYLYNGNGGTLSPTSFTIYNHSNYQNYVNSHTLTISNTNGGAMYIRITGTSTGSSNTSGCGNFKDFYFRKVNGYVYYYANGGTISYSNRKLAVGSNVGSYNTASRTGYTFQGWYTAASGGSKYTTLGNDNPSLYAHWTANQYTVTFDQKGGANGTTSVKATYDSNMPTITVPTRNGGYAFQGYYTGNNGTGTKYYNANGTSARTMNITNNTTTLYAYWKGTAFTFMNGTETVKNITFVDIPEQLTSEYTADAGDRSHPFFCGYYTASGVQVFDHNLKLTAAAKAINFGETETLYAQFISTQHTVVWDYSYRYDANEYRNLTDHNRYGRLQFKNATGTVFKTVYLTADEVNNKAVAGITGSLDTHTTSQMVVDLLVGNSSDVTTGTNAQIHFTQAELESMRGYQFDVWTNGTSTGTKAEHWYTNTNPTAHKTIFSYRGDISANMFWLSWNVTLTNLAMYPDKVYAKPMILTNNGYVEIDEMKDVWGEECFETGRVETTGTVSSVTYSGVIPVLKDQFGDGASSYKVGLTGFYLAGGNYFMHPTPGTIPSDLISSEAVSFNGDGNDPHNEIDYTVNDYDIPVVLLLPAAPNSGITDARINHLNQILYVDQARVDTVNLSRFVAQRPHFNFAGWYDTEWIESDKNKIWGANEDYVFHTHTNPNGGTRTLIALWARDTKPEAAIVMTQDDEKYIYTITATDAVEVKAVKYLIAEDGAEVSKETAGWTTIKAQDGIYSFTISHVNAYFGKHVYVLVENEGNYTIVRDEDYIRSYTVLTANPNPDTATPNGTHTQGEQARDEEGELVYDKDGEPIYEDIFTPDPENPYTYHEYYTTYYNGSVAHRVIGEVEAYVLYSANVDILSLVRIKPDANGDVVIPVDEAVILRASQAAISLEQILTDAQPDNDNILRGVDTDTNPETLGGGIFYVLSYAQFGLGFYQNLPDRDLKAHKAYFTMDAPTSVAPRGFNFDLRGEINGNGNDPIATAIENTEVQEVISGPVYNIYGHVVAPSLDQAGHLANGLYIVGGKKVVINK